MSPPETQGRSGELFRGSGWRRAGIGLWPQAQDSGPTADALVRFGYDPNGPRQGHNRVSAPFPPSA